MIAYISANLGNKDMDIQNKHTKQNRDDLDFFYFTDENFKPRTVVHPRLRAKIPKMMGWQLVPGYDFYIWGDSSMTLVDTDAVTMLLEELGDYDIAFFRHPEFRNSILEELLHMEQHMAGLVDFNSGYEYLNERYKDEELRQQVEFYISDKDFVDDKLYCGGMFIYRNTTEVQDMLANWLFHNLIYTIQDQLSLPYVLSKANLKVKVLDYNLLDCKISKRWRNCLHTSAHKWDSIYQTISLEPSAAFFGDTCTYELGAKFLSDCSTVEDWGVGTGGFKRFRPDAKGIDGSNTPHAEVVTDLRFYKSKPEGIFMRHVLEHNWDWRTILNNALSSATHKIALVLFIPLETTSRELKQDSLMNKAGGIDVPNIALGYKELIEVIQKYSCKIVEETYETETQYGKETLFLIEHMRPS